MLAFLKKSQKINQISKKNFITALLISKKFMTGTFLINLTQFEKTGSINKIFILLVEFAFLLTKEMN